MVHRQSILTLLLALLAVVLVSCGGPTESVVQAPTYTASQIERIQQYVPKLLEARERTTKQLSFEIENEEWQNASAFIHGPLGQTLLDMNNLARNLAPQVQSEARQVARSLFDDLVDIDQAAKERNATAAGRAYQATLNDFDRFFQLIPPEAQARLESVQGSLKAPTVKEQPQAVEIAPDIVPQPEVEEVVPVAPQAQVEADTLS